MSFELIEQEVEGAVIKVVGVGGAGDLGQHLHDRHLAAEGGVDVGELEADGSGADHEEPRRHAGAEGGPAPA